MQLLKINDKTQNFLQTYRTFYVILFIWCNSLTHACFILIWLFTGQCLNDHNLLILNSSVHPSSHIWHAIDVAIDSCSGLFDFCLHQVCICASFIIFIHIVLIISVRACNKLGFLEQFRFYGICKVGTCFCWFSSFNSTI